MLDKKEIEQVKETLFSGASFIYAVIDGAACPDLRFKLYDWEPNSACLWSGALEPDLEEVAPYLVLLDRESTFTHWLVSHGWNNNWNIFVNSTLDFKAFKKQIRKFLRVKSPERKNMVFRFYDPRVLDVFLENIETTQKEMFFQGINNFYYQKKRY